MTRVLSTLIPIAFVAALVAALAGCTPGQHVPHPGPAGPGGSARTPSAPATAIAADPAVPQPALNLDCAGLAAPPVVATAFGPTVHPVDPLITQHLVSPTIPDADVLQTLGGLSCEWNNGVPFVGVPSTAAYVGAQLAILPRATRQWARYDSTYGASAEGVFCTLSDPQFDCESEQLVGSNWVSIWMYGLVSESQAHTLAAAVATAVSAAAPGADPWTPPSGTGGFGGCTTLLTPGQVQSDLGITDTTIQFTQPSGGWSIQSAARDDADATGCLLQYADEDSTPGQIAWLRGGAWAFDAALTTTDAGWGASTPVSISGLAGGERAQERCTDPTTPDYEGLAICTVDLLLGGNWIQVIYEPNAGDHATAEPRPGALAMAAHLVAGYHAG